jgi:hypothetical protein
LFGEAAYRAVRVLADEAAYPQADAYWSAAEGGVGELAVVAAVDPDAGVAGGGAGCLVSGGVGPDADFSGGGFYAFDGEFGQVGQEGVEVVVVLDVESGAGRRGKRGPGRVWCLSGRPTTAT